MHGVKKQPILLLDCCPVHLNDQVWATARKNSIHLCFVPASLTWLLQPLDVTILRKMKACLRRLYRRSQIAAGSAFVPVVEVIKNMTAAIQTILQGYAWKGAFDVCGFSECMSELTSDIARFITANGNIMTEVMPRKPTDEELMCVLPKKRKYNFRGLFFDAVANATSNTIRDRAHMVKAATSVRGSGLPASSILGFPSRSMTIPRSVDADEAIALRTRSRSRLNLTEGDSQSSHPITPASAACPSSMPRAVAAVAQRPLRANRLRARALPHPRRPVML